jgi:hypothetical protein
MDLLIGLLLGGGLNRHDAKDAKGELGEGLGW